MTRSNPPPAPLHGGDLSFATARYGTPDGGWLDLSTGVNPYSYPGQPPSLAELARLPAPAALAELVQAARDYYAAPEGAEVVAVPGSELAIRLLPSISPPGPVFIVGPTYRSHLAAWQAAGRSPAMVPAVTALPDGAAIVVAANPNNPDGHTTALPTLAAVAERQRSRGGLLVVDEAFADVVPHISAVPLTATAPIIVLRSFGKFFGLPGLRLGFVIGPPEWIEPLRSLVGDWPLSAAAIAIGTTGLTDRAWQATTRSVLSREMGRLRSLLARHGLIMRGSTDLFVLIEHGDAAGLHQHLAKRGIWTRVFDDQPTWLRVGLPRGDDGFDRLARAL